MRLGKALATGIAEETPRTEAEPEMTDEQRESAAQRTADEPPEPVEVPAAR